jgi:hypothetical protein
MKKILAFVLLAAAAVSALPDPAEAWMCVATSSRARGWGTSGSMVAAKNRALSECAVRTPRGRTCYIRYCRP